MSARVYLDHAATTPVLPEARAAMADALGRWANPSSPHADGRAARAMLEDARGRIRAALGWEGDLIFTSGASEALEIALARTKRRVLVSAVEHDAVFRAAPGAGVLPLGERSQVDRGALDDALSLGPPALVAIQHVNSETGVEQPVNELAAVVRAAGGLLLSDCSQSAGKMPLPDADLIVVSAHKLGGPPGIGALLVRDLAMIEPVGGQELGYRAGTQNVPAAMGFAAAVERSQLAARPGGVAWLEALRPAIAEMRFAILAAGGRHQPASGAAFLPSILALTLPGMSSTAQLVRFDLAGISVSAGSACSSGSLKPSRALAAFGVAEADAACTIRVSFGWSTTPAEIDGFRTAWLDLAGEARARAA